MYVLNRMCVYIYYTRGGLYILYRVGGIFTIQGVYIYILYGGVFTKWEGVYILHRGEVSILYRLYSAHCVPKNWHFDRRSKLTWSERCNFDRAGKKAKKSSKHKLLTLNVTLA